MTVLAAIRIQRRVRDEMFACASRESVCLAHVNGNVSSFLTFSTGGLPATVGRVIMGVALLANLLLLVVRVCVCVCVLAAVCVCGCKCAVMVMEMFFCLLFPLDSARQSWKGDSG